MKHILPFRSAPEALAAFDNGGYFFNLFSHSKDGVVSPGELAKAAGTPLNRQAAVLYLEMSISQLSEQDRERVHSRLDQDLFEHYKKYHPQQIQFPEDFAKGKVERNVMVVGSPVKLATKSKFQGFIMVPVIVGSVTTFTFVPITSSYTVYEVNLEGGETLHVAHAIGESELPDQKLLLGGVVKTYSRTADNDREQDDIPFLEVQLYTEAD